MCIEFSSFKVKLVVETECGQTQSYALIMVQYACTLMELGQLS